MAYNELEIRSIVEKFWDGSTSLEEEALLRQLAKEDALPDEFQGVAAYFEAIEDEPMLGESFDDEMLEKLSTSSTPIFSIQRFRPLFAAAAIVIAVLGGWYFFAQQDPGPVAEEYTEEEIQQAWIQTQEALRKIGAGMEKGQEHATVINKFNEASFAITNRDQ
ncbi:MAG: hypothetical protein MK081_10500 [Flavobacteriales bacterium]|nr:hypothetical protein [Flavobacteriales bacterium]